MLVVSEMQFLEQEIHKGSISEQPCRNGSVLQEITWQHPFPECTHLLDSFFFPRGLGVIESVQKCKEDLSSEDASCCGNAISHGFWSCRNCALFLTWFGSCAVLGDVGGRVTGNPSPYQIDLTLS